jgi:4'-phosphopantetheinyl transferase
MTSSTVTVWTMQVGAPSAAALSRWHAVLDSREVARVARFHADKDRNLYIAAHALTRALLAHVGEKLAAAWQFAETEKGKPEIIDNESNLAFSLSHTAGLVACAVAHFPVGIDTESRDRKQKQADIAQTVLASSEVALLTAYPFPRQSEIFLRLWTLREAYVKATGQGISFPREDFAFTLDPLAIHFADKNLCADWQFSAWDENRHIVVLAASQRRNLTIVKRRLTEDDLL